MTCIVGLVDRNESVIIGADSCSSNGNMFYVRRDPKVFRNGDFIIGCTTSYRMIQLLRFSLILPPIGNKDIYEYMCIDFINSVRECFKQGGYLQSYDQGDERGGQFLVGYKHRLFKIDEDFQVAENKMRYDAIGSGADFALGTIYTLSRQNLNSIPHIHPANYIVLTALESARRFALGVSKPFIILNTITK